MSGTPTRRDGMTRACRLTDSDTDTDTDTNAGARNEPLDMDEVNQCKLLCDAAKGMYTNIWTWI